MLNELKICAAIVAAILLSWFSCSCSHGYRVLDQAVQKEESDIVASWISHAHDAWGHACSIKAVWIQTEAQSPTRCTTIHHIDLRCNDAFLRTTDAIDSKYRLEIDWEVLNGYWMMTGKELRRIE